MFTIVRFCAWDRDAGSWGQVGETSETAGLAERPGFVDPEKSFALFHLAARMGLFGKVVLGSVLFIFVHRNEMPEAGAVVDIGPLRHRRLAGNIPLSRRGRA